MNLSEITKRVGQLAQQAGEYIRTEKSKVLNDDVEIKSKASLVTYVDKQTEMLLVDGLKTILPEAGFLTEEGTVAAQESYLQWIIDPLDGTTNFIHGIYPHSVSIALMENGEPVVGVVFEIGQNELFSAYKGGGAYLNDEPIQVSKAAKHSDVLLATGFPYYNFEQLESYLQVLQFFMVETRGMRRMGSAAVDLAYVACGRFDGFFEHALHAWDVAAGVLLVKEAGGKITDFNGGANYLHGGELVAANANYFDAFFQPINRKLGK